MFISDNPIKRVQLTIYPQLENENDEFDFYNIMNLDIQDIINVSAEIYQLEGNFIIDGVQKSWDAEERTWRMDLELAQPLLLDIFRLDDGSGTYGILGQNTRLGY